MSLHARNAKPLRLLSSSFESSARGILEAEANPASSRVADRGGGAAAAAAGQPQQARQGGTSRRRLAALRRAAACDLRPAGNGHAPKLETGGAASPQLGQPDAMEARGSVQPPARAGACAVWAAAAGRGPTCAWPPGPAPLPQLQVAAPRWLAAGCRGQCRACSLLGSTCRGAGSKLHSQHSERMSAARCRAVCMTAKLHVSPCTWPGSPEQCILLRSCHAVMLIWARLACRELQSALTQEYKGSLPAHSGLKFLYQDIDGDWLLMHAAESWPCILATATRVMIAT